MKRIIILCFAIAPVFLWAQELGGFYISYNYGVVEDVFYPDLDVNPFSPDMASDFEGSPDYRNASQYNLGYQISEKLIVGISYMDGEICGSNLIESYEGAFTEYNAFAQYDVLELNQAVVYASASIGQVDFSASRNLVLDDGAFPHASYAGSSDKFNYGLGIRIPIGGKVSLTFDYTFDEVQHDGFDGWDYGSGVDRYTFKSIGLRCYL